MVDVEEGAVLELLVDWYEAEVNYLPPGLASMVKDRLRDRAAELGFEWGQVCVAAGLTDHWVEIDLTEEEQAEVMGLAEARLTGRQHSPTRPNASSLASQYRGAAGEVAAARWLVDEGFAVNRGFKHDNGQPDLEVNGWGIEVMSAQVSHREATGFCVPPNKLWAARQRDALGYLFVGLPPEEYSPRVWIQAFTYTGQVDADPVTNTSASPGGTAIPNHVVRSEHLYSPEHLLDTLDESR